MSEKAWYEKSITTMAALALFWPAGILHFWMYHSWSRVFSAALAALYAVISLAIWYSGASPLTAVLTVSVMTGVILFAVSILGLIAGGLTGSTAFASRKACRLAAASLFIATMIPLIIVGPSTLLGDDDAVTEVPREEEVVTDEHGHLISYLEDFRFTVESEELIVQADTNLADGMVILTRLYPQCPEGMRTFDDFLAKLDDPYDLIQEVTIADGLLDIRYDISMFSTPLGFFMPMVAESAPHDSDLDFQPDHVKDIYGERLQQLSLQPDFVYEWYHFVDGVRLEHRGIWLEFLLSYDGYRVRYERVDPP